ncbi:hypothetical protein ACEN8I_23340 [Polaromonas sp. CT11-55]|uniref:hypothetical protein n=1 Tax=Polaromonas sp. CT11-55 TaxID=3243045 RepID=UPI0039A556B7
MVDPFSVERGAIGHAPSHWTEELHFRGVKGSSDCEKGEHIYAEFNSPDFVFAVAEVWLHHEGLKHLIVPATHPGNFLESLKGLDKLISNPPSVPGMEALMPCGGWCSWMAGYWDRIDNECDTAEDEQLYDLLIPLSFLESRVGHIAVYRYGDKNIFEVAVRPGERGGSPKVGVWSQFSPDALGNEIVHLEKVIAADIRDAIKMQPL